MAKESSVAPKERVNIRFKPATGNVKEDVELPLKLLLVGDYTQRTDERPLDERSLISIDKDNFDEVLKSQELAIDLAVPSVLEDGGDPDAKLSVSLKFNRLRDFEPEQVVQQVPELKKLLELRQALVAMKGPLGNVPAFRKAIQNVLDDEGSRQRLLDELISKS